MILFHGPEALIEERLAEGVEPGADGAALGHLVIGEELEDVLHRHLGQAVQAQHLLLQLHHTTVFSESKKVDTLQHGKLLYIYIYIYINV